MAKQQTEGVFSRQQGRSFGRLMLALAVGIGVGSGGLTGTVEISAQGVAWPAPRLLTTFPMGGQAGTTFEVTVTGDNLETTRELQFSNSAISAVPLLDAQGALVPNKYTVTIAADCPPGLQEARVLTRLGVSTARVFTVSELTEVVQQGKNTTLEAAQGMEVDSIANGVLTRQGVDFYRFKAAAGERIVVDCAAEGIESKLKPVLIVADSQGADLMVERRGGAIDFRVPATGEYVVKVHDLTYEGGAPCFYRLALQRATADELVARLPSVQNVNAFSWPPVGNSAAPVFYEVEPNNDAAQAQRVELPCDLGGQFYPAADVDVYEFTARKGEVWWVEVASERLGHPTDPAVVVQRIDRSGDQEQAIDVAEFSDILSPVKVSSNGYSYDGPPYNAGSTDLIGKLEIPEDGTYRLQIHDLFGGTRSNPNHEYRLIIRPAQPDFALVGWALHMNLRNGDRNALSKPLALRGGATIPIEVVVVRRDGFDGEIALAMENLPPGVTAAGVKIPAGASRGIMLVTAAADAPEGFANASFFGTATINGQSVRRPCSLASMKWPVPNAAAEIPSPRLLLDIPVSVCGSEQNPLTLSVSGAEVWEVSPTGKVKLPIVLTRRCEFSGPTLNLQAFGVGFEKLKAFDVSLQADQSEVELDLAAIKPALTPGDYTVAFYGGAVAKYRYNLPAVAAAERELEQARQQALDSTTQAAELAELAKTVTAESKAEVERAAAEAASRKQKADADVAAAEKQLKDATATAQPKDLVDIVVSTPITIRVTSEEQK